MRALIVEDDEPTAKVLVTILASQNYVVEVASDGQMGWALLDTFPYDLLLIEATLPKRDGISLCRDIRLRHDFTPIILLANQTDAHEKAIGLDAGADDYIVKPFDSEELAARVRALMRRSSLTPSPVLEWEKLHLDPLSCEVTYSGQCLSLTAKEYAILELFLRNPRRVFSCSAILEHLWVYEEMPGEEAVRTHIKGLRQKLKAVGCSTDLIETVYGIGYRLKSIAPVVSTEFGERIISKQLRTDSTRLAGSTKLAKLSHQPVLMLLEAIWNRQTDPMSKRLEMLRQTVTALLNQCYAPQLSRDEETPPLNDR